MKFFYHDLAADICLIPSVVDFTSEDGSPIYGGNSTGKFVVTVRRFSRETQLETNRVLGTYEIRKENVKIERA